MPKTKIFFLILLTVALAWLFNLFLGRTLEAKISTWPLLNRLKILSPQTPIVITNRETVRVSDSGDAIAAANDIKSKISSLVWVGNGNNVMVGGAINLTSDGSFVTAAGSFAKSSGDYFVVLDNGNLSKVTNKVLDPATSLVFFKAALSNVPSANLGSSHDLVTGQKLIFAANSTQNFMVRVLVTSVSVIQADMQGITFQSDYPRRSFNASAGSPLINGEVLANTNADIVGIWNGSVIISSDVIKQAAALYFKNSQKISRPQFGFSYSIITHNDNLLAGQAEGALVLDLSATSPARSAGLLSGDIITAVDNKAVSESSLLEEILQKYKPGDKLGLTVSRKNQILNLSLTASELK